MSRKSLRAGDALFREREAGQSAFLIESGMIRIFVGQGGHLASRMETCLVKYGL